MRHGAGAAASLSAFTRHCGSHAQSSASSQSVKRPPVLLGAGRLRRLGRKFALTGTLAAGRLAPVAPPRLAAVYVDDLERAASDLGLRPADSGANVLLIEPADPAGVFTGAVESDGLVFAAPSQAAADLLTSPGRGPAEAEALIAWMSEHEETWRG